MNTLRALFEEISALPEAEREPFLRRRGIDAAMRAQLERLLAADRDEGEPAHRGFATLARGLGEAEPGPALPAGTRIGPFELVAPLGEGGSATVYRAQRVAGGVVQAVALKILHRNVLTAHGRRQFDRERQALAQLRHPHIAGLIDGGVTEAGIAWLALELVEGRSLTAHAAEARLDVDARLRLFLATCRAVEAAHQALIVHRDLKPQNILVTGEGHVTLVDFGIAKRLRDDTEATATLHRSFTPAYSAPEQRAGGPISTATDVYALGVVLGELLTGVRLRADDPRPPSSLVDAQAAPGVLPAPPRPLRRRLRGDLDNIVLKAVAAEPRSRYASAGALADDIERALDGLPVSAHPPSRWYRARKFVARHQGSVAVTVVLALATLAGLVLAVWQGAVARQEAAAARAEAARANALRGFVFDLFAEAEPSAPRKGPMTVLEAVERAYDLALQDAAAEPRTRLELLSELAEVQRRQGGLEVSAGRLRYVHAQAEALFGPDDPLVLDTGFRLARSDRQRGRADEARRRLDALLRRVPEQSALRIELLRLSAALAARPERDAARALRESEAALALSRAGGEAGVLRESLSNHAIVLIDLGRTAEAIPVMEEVLAMNRAAFGPRHEKVALALAALARAYRRTGDLDGAERNARAAVAMDREIYPGDHWITSNHLNALALILEQRGDLEAAVDTAAESLRVSHATLGSLHQESVIAHGVLANLLQRAGRDVEALEHWRETLREATAALGPDHRQAAYARAMLGHAIAQSGDPAAGAAEMDRALALLAQGAAAESEARATTLERRIMVALAGADAAQAARRLAELESLLPALGGGNPYWNGRTQTLRGELLLLQGDAPGARRLLAEAAPAIDAASYPGRLLRATNALLLGEAALACGDRAEALAHAARGRALLAGLPHVPPRLHALASRLPRA